MPWFAAPVPVRSFWLRRTVPLVAPLALVTTITTALWGAASAEAQVNETELRPRLYAQVSLPAQPQELSGVELPVQPLELLSPSLEATPLEVARGRFLRSQEVFAGAFLLSALALTYGVYQYTRQHRWQRLAYLRQVVQEFEHSPEIRNALKILDFEEYRDYPIQTGDVPVTFQVTNELLIQALASHEDRVRKKKALDMAGPGRKQAPDAHALQQYQIETELRDWFNKMLNGLEHFGYLLDSKAVTKQELAPWLIYWIRLISDPKYRRGSASKFYDQLYNYVHNYGFMGVQRLFERYGYRILPSPFRDDDLKGIKKPHQYSTRLALMLAKSSYLIYYGKQYVAEISKRWGISIKDDFRYFNNRGQDTQAFMFRTDEYMVLAFRGSQETRDWYTNISTKLREFTIRKAGITTLSTYKGRVHSGFFVAWASIERAVLDQLGKWKQQTAAQGKPLPPLLITGHSLGGALASMAAASLNENGIEVMGVYTFGQPRVGDWQFSRQLSKRLDGRIFRFINNNDVVPHLPPPFSPLSPLRFYTHLGSAKYFNSKGLLMLDYRLANRLWDSAVGLCKGLFESGIDLLADHNMEYYISSLKRSYERELENRAAERLAQDKTRV
ncbi:MAG: lipase family protein [Cyanobacteria bacterium J06632_22]